MTVHRRFLLPSSFARLIQRERGGLRYVEGFFPEQRDRSSWVRLDENKGLLILKTSGRHGDGEEQTEIPVAHAHALLDVCAGEIEYVRTVMPIGEGHALVDEFRKPYRLHLVTVAFDTDEKARRFPSPAWLGPEVTEDPRFTHQGIALRGGDQVPEIPLSDGSLNSLLDTLEGRFPAQARMAVRQTKPMPMGTVQVSERSKVSLGEIENAMMREMERASRMSRSE